jgi:hypothetical protein
MYRLSTELNTTLTKFAQRKLEKGEIFILAKVIADTLELAPHETDNIRLFTLTKKRFINEVIYTLNDYTYLDDQQRETIFKLIDELSLWRYNIAYKPPMVFFNGDTNTVVDDVTCILRYVDVTYACAVADIIDNANWLYGVFVALCKEVTVKVQSQDETP